MTVVYYQKNLNHLNVELFIARRLFQQSGKSVSQSVVKIAMVAITLGLAVMIVAVAIVMGFKQTIKDKVVGFGSHIQIVNYDSNTSYETAPITKQPRMLADLRSTEGITQVQSFAIKAGIIKTNDAVQGVVLKGVGADFDWSFFKQHIVEGAPLALSDTGRTNQVLISRAMANMLSLKLGDSFVTSFVPRTANEGLRYRSFVVGGIYQTNLEEFDKRFLVVDIHHIQKLNNWTNDQISGYEVLIDNFDRIDERYEQVMDVVGYGFLPDGSKLKVQSIEEVNPQIFAWLGLLDMNVWVILVLMVVVAGMNMITGLLVIILEKTQVIGILKAIGSPNVSIRKVFLYNGAFLIGKGLLWGNVLGIAICALQYFFKIVPLNPETYFIDSVPIYVSVSALVVLNIGTLLVTIAMLVLPTIIITKISPVKAIRFE